MKIIIEGEPKEIAALALAVQERQNTVFTPEDSSGVLQDESSRKCCC